MNAREISGRQVGKHREAAPLGIQCIKAPDAHGTGANASPVLPSHKAKVECRRSRAEGRKPNETACLPTKCAHGKGLRGVEAGKVFLGEDGTLRLSFEFTGSNVHLADAMSAWCERLLGQGAAPTVKVSIISEGKVGPSRIMNTLGRVAKVIDFEQHAGVQ